MTKSDFLTILLLPILFLPILPITRGTDIPKLASEPRIRAFNEYVYVSKFNLSCSADQLRSHFITIIGEDCSENELHNFTAIIETDESIINIQVFPNCRLFNQSSDLEHYINTLFNGTSFNLEVWFNPTKICPDPINFSITPSDTDFFSLDLQNNLKFGMWLNVSKPLASVWINISPRSQPSAKPQRFIVETELETGINYTTGNEIKMELVDVPVGCHYLQFEICYEGSEGNFYVSLSIKEEGTFFLPALFYLDGNEVSVDRTLLLRYSSYNVEFLKGVFPWIYGYRDPEYYNLNYLSPKQFLLRIDKSSRESIEYLLLDAEIERVSIEEIYIHGNPTYELVLELYSNSNVVLGLGLYEKAWFLQPSKIKIADIPPYIREAYTNPSSSFDEDYIDVNNSLVFTWAKQVVGNETNPYFIAYSLYQNLTQTLEYDHNLTEFYHETEFAGTTLASTKGVCRHFARAFAALCMAVDLPAKTVSGTTFGNLNDTRKKNHEWNEVYFPGCGWVTVDITWKDFCVLSNAHSIYTHWLAYSDTLEVEELNQSRRLALKEKDKESLHSIVHISEERLRDITSNESLIIPYSLKADEAYELLAQASNLVESGDVHQSLLLICEANLLIDDLEESHKATSWFDDIPLWVGPLVVVIVCAIIGVIAVLRARCHRSSKERYDTRVQENIEQGPL